MTVAVPDYVEPLKGRSGRLLSASHRGDGRQFVLLVEGPDGPVILKHYGLKRSGWKTALRQLGFRLGLGLSSVWPRDRFRTERDLLALWREAGCDAPRVLAAGTDRHPWLLLEYCPGPTLKSWLGSDDTPLADKRARLRQLAAAVGHRHRLALARQEPRLIHTHPSTQHVLVSGPRLVFFDLETSYRRRSDVRSLVLRELAELLPSALRWLPEHMDEAVGDFVEAYPDPDVLADLRPLASRAGRAAARARRAASTGDRHPAVPLARVLELAGPHLARTASR